MYDVVKDVLIPVASILISVVVAYLTAVYALRRETKQGKLRLLELVRRYFLNVFNAFDQDSNRIKKDALSKKMYVEELRSILKELGDLVAHPYFTVLVARYPLLSKLLIQSRREILEHESNDLFAVNVGTMTEFWRLHQVLRQDLPLVMKSELDTTIIKLAERLELKNVA